jgi:hypothetical protein
MTTETKELTVLERVQNGVTQKHSFDGRSREGKTVRRLHNIAGYTATDVFYQVTPSDSYARTTWYTQLSLTGTQPQTLVDEYVHLSGEVVYLSSEVIVEVVSDKALYFAGHKVELVDGEIVRTPYEVVAPSWHFSLENADREKYRWVNNQWDNGQQLEQIKRLIVSRKEDIEREKELNKLKVEALTAFNLTKNYFEQLAEETIEKLAHELDSPASTEDHFDNAIKAGVAWCAVYMRNYLHKTTVDIHDPRGFRMHVDKDVRVYTAVEAYAFTVQAVLQDWEQRIPKEIKLKVLEQFSKKVWR